MNNRIDTTPQLTNVFAALSDPTRFRVVDLLVREGEQPAGRLVEQVDMSGPAVSRHLKILRQAGLIEQRVSGTRRYYSVCPQTLQTIADWSLDRRAFWEASLDRLDAYLSDEKE